MLLFCVFTDRMYNTQIFSAALMMAVTVRGRKSHQERIQVAAWEHSIYLETCFACCVSLQWRQSPECEVIDENWTDLRAGVWQKTQSVNLKCLKKGQEEETTFCSLCGVKRCNMLGLFSLRGDTLYQTHLSTFICRCT